MEKNIPVFDLRKWQRPCAVLFVLLFGFQLKSQAKISAYLNSLSFSTPTSSYAIDNGSLGPNDQGFQSTITLSKKDNNTTGTGYATVAFTYDLSDMTKQISGLYLGSYQFVLLYNGGELPTTKSTVVFSSHTDLSNNQVPASPQLISQVSFGSLQLPGTPGGTVNFGVRLYDNTIDSKIVYENFNIASLTLDNGAYFQNNVISINNSSVYKHENTSIFWVTIDGTVPTISDGSKTYYVHWESSADGVNGWREFESEISYPSLQTEIYDPCTPYYFRRTITNIDGSIRNSSNVISVVYDGSYDIQNNIISLNTDFGANIRLTKVSEQSVLIFPVYGSSPTGAQTCSTKQVSLTYAWQYYDGSNWVLYNNSSSNMVNFLNVTLADGHTDFLGNRDRRVRRVISTSDGSGRISYSNEVSLIINSCSKPTVGNTICGDQTVYGLTGDYFYLPKRLMGAAMTSAYDQGYQWEMSTDLNTWQTVSSLSRAGSPDSDFLPHTVQYVGAKGGTQKFYYRRKYYQYYDPCTIPVCGVKAILQSTSNVVTITLTGNSAPVDPQNKTCIGQDYFWQGNVNGDATSDIVTYNPRTQNWWFGQMANNQRIQWVNAYNTWGFGPFGSNHMLLQGDFDGDKNKDICFYYKGDQNWYTGLSKNNTMLWSYTCNTTGFGYNLLDGQHLFWTGDFNGDKTDDIIMYSRSDGDWYINPSAASSGWIWVGNTSGQRGGPNFGDIGTSAYAIWPADYNGDGYLDFLFYYNTNQNWQLGLSDGNSLHWHDAGSTSWAGNLLTGSHLLWQVNFNEDNKADMLFYHKGDGNWFKGIFNGTSLVWTFANNTSGDLMSGNYSLFPGDYNGDKKGDMLMYNKTNSNWSIGYSDGNVLNWGTCGNSSGFGLDITSTNFKYFTNDFTGDTKSDILFYNQGSGDWELGTFVNGALIWKSISNTGVCDQYESQRVDDSNTFLIAEGSQEEQLNIFPNPVSKEEEQLRFSKTVGSCKLSTLSGVKLRQEENVSSVEIADLNPGLYLLELDGKQFKFVVK